MKKIFLSILLLVCLVSSAEAYPNLTNPYDGSVVQNFENSNASVSQPQIWRNYYWCSLAPYTDVCLFSYEVDEALGAIGEVCDEFSEQGLCLHINDESVVGYWADAQAYAYRYLDGQMVGAICTRTLTIDTHAAEGFLSVYGVRVGAESCVPY